MSLRTKLQGVLLVTFVLSATAQSGGCIIYTPPRTDCMPDNPDQWQCETWTYSADGEEFVSRDMITNASMAEEAMLSAQGKHYASKFSLSEEQGLKIARQIHHFDSLKTRSDADIAEFAKRLYGVNPRSIIAAVGKAQAGDISELNQLTEQAAKNFSTTPQNMKRIVKSLHGELLRSQGISY
jgi:hypothetical protein